MFVVSVCLLTKTYPRSGDTPGAQDNAQRAGGTHTAASRQSPAAAAAAARTPHTHTHHTTPPPALARMARPWPTIHHGNLEIDTYERSPHAVPVPGPRHSSQCHSGAVRRQLRIALAGDIYIDI